MSRQAEGSDRYFDGTRQEHPFRKKPIQIDRRRMIVRITDDECENRILFAKHGEPDALG